MTLVVETERLVLRQWTESDLDPFTSLCSDPEVMQWIADGSRRTRLECAAAIQRFRTGWDDRGFDLFAVDLKRDRQFVGFCGLSIPTFLPEVLPAVEIGWRLARSHWGNGFATEAAKVSLRYGFDNLGLDEIISIHQIGNDASARIMHKIGMSFSHETIDPTCNRSVHVYRTLSKT